MCSLDVDGYTALMIASYNGYIDIVEKITSRLEGKEKGWGLFELSNKSESSLFFACVKVNLIVIQILLHEFIALTGKK